MPNTVRLHRVLATKPDKVYRAFIEADALAKWLPPNGFTCNVHHLDAKVGGTFKMSFRNFTTGKSHSFGGEYLELVPGERLRYTDKFDDPNLPGEMQVTVTLKTVIRRHRGEHRAGGHSRRHSGGSVLSRLAGIAAQPRQAGRAGDQSVAQGWVSCEAGNPPANFSRVQMVGCGLFPRLEIAQVRRRLVLLGRHQIAVAADEIVLLADHDVVVVLGAVVLVPVGLAVAAIVS